MAVRTLTETPSFRSLYARAIAPQIPFLGGRTRGSRLTTTPDVELRLNEVPIEPGPVGAYRRVCRFPTTAGVPSTYLHNLAFPLQLELMTDPAFPFPAMGSVHVANTIRQIRPVAPGDLIDLSVRAADLRPHPKGRLITLASEATRNGELVWRDESHYLNRGKSDSSATAEEYDVPDEPPSGPQRWRLPGSLGRQYAAVSGDRNPIHLSMPTARAFGFRRQIAHGMWSMGRCLAELTNRLPDAYTVTVAFKKPIYLPGSVAFGARDDGDAIDFGLRSPSSGAPHVVGRISRG